MRVWVTSNGRNYPEVVFDNEAAAVEFAGSEFVVPWPLEVSGPFEVVSSVEEAKASYGD